MTDYQQKAHDAAMAKIELKAPQHTSSEHLRLAAHKLHRIADEHERLRTALLWIASMADEDNEWDGVERFRMARQKAIDAVSPSVEPAALATNAINELGQNNEGQQASEQLRG